MSGKVLTEQDIKAIQSLLKMMRDDAQDCLTETGGSQADKLTNARATIRLMLDKIEAINRRMPYPAD